MTNPNVHHAPIKEHVTTSRSGPDEPTRKPGDHAADQDGVGTKLHAVATEIARQIGGEYERRDDEAAVGKTLYDQVGDGNQPDTPSRPRHQG